jgi:hypothetical protein
METSGLRGKKDRGETEAQIIREAEAGTRVFKSRLSTKLALQGAAVGVVGVPVADWLKESRPSWREVAKRSPKTTCLGILLGAGAGWAAGKLRNDATADDLKSHWHEFKHNTHEMEMAWTEALTKRVIQELASTSKENGPAR